MIDGLSQPQPREKLHATKKKKNGMEYEILITKKTQENKTNLIEIETIIDIWKYIYLYSMEWY